MVNYSVLRRLFLYNATNAVMRNKNIRKRLFLHATTPRIPLRRGVQISFVVFSC